MAIWRHFENRQSEAAAKFITEVNCLIKLAKLIGVYKGRVAGSKEDVVSFLSKTCNKEALAYLKKGGIKAKEIAKLTGVHINTITKIKKLGMIAPV